MEIATKKRKSYEKTGFPTEITQQLRYYNRRWTTGLLDWLIVLNQGQVGLAVEDRLIFFCFEVEHWPHEILANTMPIQRNS